MFTWHSRPCDHVYFCKLRCGIYLRGEFWRSVLGLVSFLDPCRCPNLGSVIVGTPGFIDIIYARSEYNYRLQKSRSAVRFIQEDSRRLSALSGLFTEQDMVVDCDVDCWPWKSSGSTGNEIMCEGSFNSSTSSIVRGLDIGRRKEETLSHYYVKCSKGCDAVGMKWAERTKISPSMAKRTRNFLGIGSCLRLGLDKREDRSLYLKCYKVLQWYSG